MYSIFDLAKEGQRKIEMYWRCRFDYDLAGPEELKSWAGDNGVKNPLELTVGSVCEMLLHGMKKKRKRLLKKIQENADAIRKLLEDHPEEEDYSRSLSDSCIAISGAVQLFLQYQKLAKEIHDELRMEL